MLRSRTALWLAGILRSPQARRIGLAGAGALIGFYLGASVLGVSLPLAVLLAFLGAGVGLLPALIHRGDAATTHGAARLRSQQELAPLQGTSGLIVGRAPEPDGGLLRYGGPAHLVTIAPTRAGKGVGAIIPNLLLTDGPVFVIDPKGENYRVTARARAPHGPVYALDPFASAGESTIAYNPLDQLDPQSDQLADDAAGLANAIVADPPGQVREAHWNGEAAALIAGLILFCVCTEPPAQRNLARVRSYLTLPPEEFRGVIESMQRSKDAGGLIARAANRRIGQNEREAASVLSTAQRHTHFLDSAPIARCLERTDFRFSEVASKGGSVFLILPPDRIASYSRWLRILVVQAISEIIRMGRQPERPLLFLLDECAALGRISTLERAVGLMAGYGMQIWCIFQDLHQLRSIYGSGAGTILSNAGIVQAFNVNDLDTAKWLSATMGGSTVSFKSGGPGAMRVGRPLLTADEVLNLPPDRILLLVQEGRPVLADKLRYFRDREFEGLFDGESSFGAAPVRA